MHSIHIPETIDNMSEIYSGLVDGQPYIIGREGQIYIRDEYVSRRHAVIRLYKGRITLRDLGSGNGMFIFKNGEYEAFRSGFVKEDDRVMIGSEQYYVHDLLERISLAQLR
jgi:hypothetical protein